MKAIIINLAGFVRPVLTTGLRQPPPSHSDWNGMGEVKSVSEVSEVSSSEFPLPLRCDVGPPANPVGTSSLLTLHLRRLPSYFSSPSVSVPPHHPTTFTLQS